MKRPLCPRCGSNGLYRDDDPVTGVMTVACQICGHRIFPGADPELSKAIVKAREERNKEEEEPMQKRGCTNCKRDKATIRGLCMTCIRGAIGTEGPARVAALAEVKRKIETGEIQSRVYNKKAAAHPPGPATHPASAPVISIPIPWSVGGPLPPVGETQELREAPAVVPVTLRLAIEITVKVNGVAA